MSRRLPLAAGALILAACVSEPAPEPLPQGDVEAFAATVQPVLGARCGETTCHGRPDRPLALYTERRYRRDPSLVFAGGALDAEELAANVRSVSAFMLEAAEPDACEVLRKPLAEAAGGAWHDGGDIFASREDREYRAVRAWLASLDPQEGR